jgi:hypothetical protein
MEEQRIKTLEEEFKVLKNQIKAVLLDIKEQLATGVNGQSGAPQWAGVSAAIPQAENDIKVVPESLSGEPGFTEKGSSAGIAERAEPALDFVMNRSGVPGVAGSSTDTEGRVDLLTVSVLSQWLTRAAASVSKAQICKLVEIYDITGNLPPRLKQVILLLADLYGNGSHAEEEENLPATASMQLLIELDSLLRYRTGALESVVLSMLLDKGQKNKGQKNRRSG